MTLKQKAKRHGSAHYRGLIKKVILWQLMTPTATLLAVRSCNTGGLPSYECELKGKGIEISESSQKVGERLRTMPERMPSTPELKQRLRFKPVRLSSCAAWAAQLVLLWRQETLAKRNIGVSEGDARGRTREAWHTCPDQQFPSSRS